MFDVYCVSRIVCLFVYVHREEATEYVEIGALNGLFVLGRSIGFIGEQPYSELSA